MHNLSTACVARPWKHYLPQGCATRASLVIPAVCLLQQTGRPVMPVMLQGSAVIRKLERHTTIKSCNRDEGGCGRTGPMQQFVEGCQPRAFALQLVWESLQEAGQDIRHTIDLIYEVRSFHILMSLPPHRDMHVHHAFRSWCGVSAQGWPGHERNQGAHLGGGLPCSQILEQSVETCPHSKTHPTSSRAHHLRCSWCGSHRRRLARTSGTPQSSSKKWHIPC